MRSSLDARRVRALVFDAWFDSYVGAVMVVRVMEGKLALRERVKFMVAGVEREIQQLSVVDPTPRSVKQLEAGEVGRGGTGRVVRPSGPVGRCLADVPVAIPACDELDGARVSGRSQYPC